MTEVTITSNDGREAMQVDVDVTPDVRRLVLAAANGHEFHFGCGSWSGRGTFTHVATYTSDGRTDYPWWSDVIEGIKDASQRQEPCLGPLVSPLVTAMLEGLALICSQHKGFLLDEKKWAVERLRALRAEDDGDFDPEEIGVWAATHGWSVKDANGLVELAAGVQHGTKFRSYDGRAIQRDRAREQKMVAHWRSHSASHPPS